MPSGTADYPPPGRGEPHWPPLACLATAIALQFVLPNELIPGPRWLLPGLETLLMVGLISVSPYRISGRNRTRRRVSLSAIAIVSATNGVSLALLCRLLLRHNVANGHQLIVAGALIWLTNVLLFALWYWEQDRGGPGVRAAGEDGPPDLLFPQISADGPWGDWRPQFLDYLYVSLTNATAFSPTDTMPLTVEAKMVMGLQSVISLVTIGLIISRAVNIL
ncbi:MAG TPA: hypothetical protein VFN48_00570 [Solirubrobacteraceae bacterium]|nr:hypothetical protein [Solirubrobacteraceae bacterium]